MIMNISFEILVITALVISAITLLFSYTRTASLRAKLARNEDILHSLQADLNAVCSGALGLGEHLAHLEQRAHQMSQRQEKIEMEAPSSQSYRHAMKLVDKGANLEEVIADCGLARGEAELVALAHRIKKAS